MTFERSKVAQTAKGKHLRDLIASTAEFHNQAEWLKFAHEIISPL